MDRTSRRVLGALGGLAGLLLGGWLLIVNLTATDPIEAAKALADGGGASFLGLKLDDGFFGGSAPVRLQPAGEGGKPIELHLVRPFWSRQWKRVPAGP